jgi:tetratricopeptide (TPR) repeat protein
VSRGSVARPMSWHLAWHGRRGRRWRLAGTLLVVSILALWIGWRSTSSKLCAREANNDDRRFAIWLCSASYRTSGDHRDLFWLARSYLRESNCKQAIEVAHQLLRGPLRGDAHTVLGYCAMRENGSAAAMVHARMAIAYHTAAADSLGLARDEVSLSQAAWSSGDFDAALAAADRALTHPATQRDPHLAVTAYLARADALRRIGDLEAAQVAARNAIERAVSPLDLSWAHLKHALCLVGAELESLALQELSVAAAANRVSDVSILRWQIAMNEAYLLRRRDPAGARARLEMVARENGESLEIWLLSAYLAADRGDLDEAERMLVEAERSDEPDADWLWEVVLASAQLAELRGGIFGAMRAERHYRRAIASVAGLRRTARGAAAMLVSSHRAPYDGLLSLLARQGRWRDALAVLLDLDAGDMLRATAGERAARDGFEFGLTAAPVALAITPRIVDEVVAAWRGRDLVIVFAEAPRQIGAGNERAYRLRVHDGGVSGQEVGDAAQVRKWAADLYTRPNDVRSAQEVGKLIVPVGDSSAPLTVLAVGPLGKTPLAALRANDGSLLSGKRPLVRVMALRARSSAAPGNGAPVVIADPRGDLPSAATEGRVASSAIGATVRKLGPHADEPATKERLWAARDASWMHLASHVDATGRWRALQVADGEVEPVEIRAHGLAPRVAVLASCGSAAATDPEGWGSLAAALLDAGTTLVVATDRNVDDEVSLAVMASFYAQPDRPIDPARALARAQQEIERTTATSSNPLKAATWAAYTALVRPPVVPD